MPSKAQRFHLVYVFERFPTFTQTFCVREILELERQGVRPLIFSLRDTRDEPAQDYPASLRDRVHYLPEPSALTRFVRDLRSAKKVPKPVDHTLRYWRKAQPDKRRVYEAAYIGHRIRQIAPYLRHAHAHFAGMAARTLWWLRQFEGISYSFTAHANDIFCEVPPSPVTLQNVVQNASRIVTVSDFSVDTLSQAFPRAQRKIRRVYNGLDLKKWIPENHSNDSPAGIGSCQIYSVGRLIEKKGFPHLIRASALLRDREIPHQVHIIGSGPLQSDLEREIDDLDLRDHVVLEGELSQDAIVERLNHEAHLFALPCVREADGGMDNLPTVIMEAMAAGLPCVSTRLAGIPEMIDHGETGLLVPPGDDPALADALETLLKDPERCRHFGLQGRQIAMERFDQSVTARKLTLTLAGGGSVRFSPAKWMTDPGLWSPALRSCPGRLLRLVRPRPRFSAARFLESLEPLPAAPIAHREEVEPEKE